MKINSLLSVAQGKFGSLHCWDLFPKLQKGKQKLQKNQRPVSYSLECSFQSRRKLIGHGHFPVSSVKRKAIYRQAEHYKILLALPHASVI